MPIWVQVQWEPFWAKIQIIIKKLWFTKSLVQFRTLVFLQEPRIWISAVHCQDNAHTFVCVVPYLLDFCFPLLVVIMNFSSMPCLIVWCLPCPLYQWMLPLIFHEFNTDASSYLSDCYILWNQTPSYFFLSHSIACCAFLMPRVWCATLPT